MMKKNYFSAIGPRSWRPGKISASGFEVSTVVETIAMYHPFCATMFELETHEM